MDKNAIKKYAVWARRELISRVSQRAALYGITSEGIFGADTTDINGRLLGEIEKKQRRALIEQIRRKGYQQVMEGVAYTWFNRFAALRFMEVNGFLPSYVRVFTNDENEFKPQILTEAINLELEGLDMQKVYELKNANDNDELFKYLLITQCNALNSILPRMFQKLDDYTEILLPDHLLRDGSVIEQMIALIPENDWTDQVQIIGWLYQYYNTEPKDKVFADLKKNVKISKENIPAATQLFTPDWIVHYMVENSLGRLWLEGHPNDELKSEWKYYLDEAAQEPEAEAQLAEIRKEYAALKPEDIKVIDPCMGSGHILCVLFDVLVRIYEDYGYTAREAVIKIVEKNLWGLDIDERAAQLSYFAVMMKARQYDHRFLMRNIQPHVYAIEESNGITSAPMHDMGLQLSQEEYSGAVKQTMRLVEEMHDAKEYGSIIQVTPCDWDLLRRFAVPRDENGQLRLDIHGEVAASERLQKMIDVGEALAQKYHAVITNPPYMGAGNMDEKLGLFLKKNYRNTKSDLSTVFMERTLKMCCKNGFSAMINIPVWMFISSYSSLRANLLSNKTIINMLHLGRGVFGSDFGTTSFVFRNSLTMDYISFFQRLYLVHGAVDTVKQKEKWFFEKIGIYYQKGNEFQKIPGTPFAYWVSNEFVNSFTFGKPIGNLGRVSEGIKTGDNEKYLRFWHEIDSLKFSFADISSHTKWVPYHKGGDFRKWYGNNIYAINWENDGFEIKHQGNSGLQGQSMYFTSVIGYSKISARGNPLRYFDAGVLFDSMAPSISVGNKQLYVLGLLNSAVGVYYIRVLNPTMATQVGDIKNIPVIFDHIKEVERIVESCIQLSKSDWNAFETSWGFKEHPFTITSREVTGNGRAVTISQAFYNWQDIAGERFRKLKENEEELNRIFIDIYGLGAELTPEVEDKDVTVRRADLQREVRSFISYAVGCMFGRYTIGVHGLVYAGGEWDASKYPRFQPDEDAIIPICDDEFFEDDIVGRFVNFVEVVYGKETLEENLNFIANALGGKGSSRDVIRSYFINDFYVDHLKVYQKRPIYWLFDSGKKNSFKCLTYIHRYQPDTIARIRTDYVHEQQSRYQTMINDIENRVVSAETSEKVKLNKQLKKVTEQAEELRVYEEKIHHLADQMIEIDLDDGVKHNYAIFQDILAKIK